jgi:hypothetical protein
MEGLAFVSITNQIKDGYLGKSGTDWVADLSAQRKKQLDQAKTITDGIWGEIDKVQKSGNRAVDINQFTGRYSDVWLGDANISVKNGKLWFDAKRSPKLTGEMFPYKGNTFVVKWADLSMPGRCVCEFQS